MAKFSFGFILIYPVFLFCYSYSNCSFLNANVGNQLGAYGHLHSRISEANSIQDVDVLALGSSFCYRGIDPRYFQKYNLNLFNLGSSGQTHIQTSILLETYLKQFNPKLVIYECNPSIFYNDGVGSGLDLIYNSDFSPSHLNMAIEINNIKLYNGLLNSGIRKTLGLDDDFTEKQIIAADTYISGGYVEKKLSYFQYIKPLKVKQKPFQPLECQLEAFLKNIACIKQSGAELVLINAPVTRYIYSTYSYSLSSDSLFSNSGKFINFNHLMALDDSLHFYDENHLNQKGVELFNIELIRVLLNK